MLYTYEHCITQKAYQFDTYCGIIDNLRLASGRYPWEGRVEVFVLGQWGTVDGENWDSQDGDVVCRKLGFSVNGL